MGHISYQAGPKFEADADYVVIGSGAGGAAAAVGLARGGASVAIVEAGAWRDPEDYPSSVWGAMRDLFDDFGARITVGRAYWPVVQARTVGGTTVINSAIVVRTPGDIFAQWKREFGVGGDEMAEAVWGYQDAVERELNVTEIPPEARGRTNELAFAASQALGIEGHIIHRNVTDCEATGQCLQGCRKGRKQSTNLNYVPEVIRRGGHVLSSAPVQRILLEGTRAVGVTGRFEHPVSRKKGAEFVVRAKKAVVLAASVTHSPVILMNSGITFKGVGANFRSHPGTGVFGVYDEVVDMNTGATQGWASMHYRDDPGMKLETLSLPLELVASRLSGGGVELMQRLKEYRHIAMWVAAVRAESVGRVKKGFGGKPMVHYSITKADCHRLRMGLYHVAQLHFAVGAKSVIPGIHGMPYKLGPDQVDLLKEAPLDPRYYVGILSHLFGGCTMGRDPKSSVCDGNGRVHGHQGLYIADASAIPSTLGVNPQHTVMGMARLRADQLLNQ